MLTTQELMHLWGKGKTDSSSRITSWRLGTQTKRVFSYWTLMGEGQGKICFLFCFYKEFLEFLNLWFLLFSRVPASDNVLHHELALDAAGSCMWEALCSHVELHHLKWCAVWERHCPQKETFSTFSQSPVVCLHWSRKKRGSKRS